MSEVHNATLRQLWATTSSSPRMKKMKAAPTSGRKVTSERSGQSLIASTPHHDQIPGHQCRYPDQHDEGVMVDVARLQPNGAPGRLQGRGCYAIRAEAVDDR